MKSKPELEAVVTSHGFGKPVKPTKYHPMSTKKKPTKKATAKKATKTTDFDDALELPAAKTVVAIEPMEATMEDALDETAGEDWPNYSPFPEEENEGVGYGPDESFVPPSEEGAEPFCRVLIQPEQKDVTDVVSLGAGEPVSASDPLSGTGIPSDASKTVRDLLDGLNYLWKMAQTIRGPRGPKMHDESILKKRVAKGRELEKLLAGLK
jgi:hypothetical protein